MVVRNIVFESILSVDNRKRKTLIRWSLWAQQATPAGSHPQPHHLKIHGSKITVGSDYNPNRTKICTNVTLLMLGIHCYHHLCNVTSTIILVSPRLGLPGAWNSHVACLERTKQNKKGISAHNFHQVGEDFTSSHKDPRLSGPLRSCWGLKPVLWIEGNYLHWAAWCFKPSQKGAHTWNPLSWQLPFVQIRFPKQHLWIHYALPIPPVHIAQLCAVLKVPLSMEVQQETGRGHGFLSLAVLNISLYIEIERYLYSTNCCVELSVSRLSLWRSLSSVLYCPIWIEFRSGKVFKDPEIWFEKNCIFTCATCSQSGEAPNQSWQIPMEISNDDTFTF